MTDFSARADILDLKKEVSDLKAEVKRLTESMDSIVDQANRSIASLKARLDQMETKA